MAKATTLVSSWTALTDETFRFDHLKLCCLWYDEVLFESIGDFDQTRYLEQILEEEPNSGKIATKLSDIILPVDSRVDAEMLEELQEPAGYPRWGQNLENYKYPEPENPKEFAHNKLLEKIEGELGVTKLSGLSVEHAEGRARVATDAVKLWQRVNAFVPCILQANSDERDAMSAALEYSLEPKQQLSPASVLQTAVPSLRNVSWNEILRLKSSNSLAGF